MGCGKYRLQESASIWEVLMLPRSDSAGRIRATRRGVRSARTSGLVLAAGLASGCLFGLPALAAVPGPPSVLHVGQIARQDVPVLPGSEPDTLVEPDVG